MTNETPIPDPTGARFKPQPLIDFRKTNPERIEHWMLRNVWWIATLL
jgi:hypothetical protein